MSFRDSSVVVIETDSKWIKAGRDMTDPFPPPTIEIQARVGLRKSARAISDTDLSNIRGALLNGNGSGTPVGRASVAPQSTVKLRPSSYLVGHFLDQAETNGEELDIFWPFAQDDVKDWVQAEAIWKYVLFHAFQLRRTQNEFPVLLCLPISLPRSTHEQISQMFFERFNVAALAIFEKPILQLFAANAISGVVVDVGEEYTEITAIVDAMVHYPSILPFEGGPHSVPLGTRHCELYLAQILRSNQALIAKISPPQSPLPELMLTSVLLKIVRQALQDGLIKVPSDGLPVPPDTEEEGVTNIAAVLVAGKERAVIEAGSRKKSALNEKKGAAEREREREIAALDLVDVEVSFFPNEGSSGSMEEERTIKVTLGKERHRFAEPLFSPSLLEGVPEVSPEQLSKKMLGLHEAIRLIVGSVDWDKRPSVWDAVYLTGDLIGVKNLEFALKARLQPFVIADPEMGSEYLSQPKDIQMKKVPEYFSRFRDNWDRLSAYLGACIVAKLTFNDQSGRFVSKADYAVKGPGAIADVVF